MHAECLLKCRVVQPGILSTDPSASVVAIGESSYLSRFVHLLGDAVSIAVTARVYCVREAKLNGCRAVVQPRRLAKRSSGTVVSFRVSSHLSGFVQLLRSTVLIPKCT